MELVDFLRARLDEDERIARAAADELDGPVLGSEWHYDGRYVEAVRERTMVAVGSQDFMEPGTGTHIAAHDPARVLAEVEAKQRVVDLTAGMLEAAKGDSEVDHYGGLSVAEDTLLLLARPFRDHPDFDPSWLPG